jgi:kumamolisin
MNQQLLPVPGVKPQLGSMFIGYPKATEKIDFVLKLKGRDVAPDKQEQLNKLINDPPHLRKYLSHDDLEELYGADHGNIKLLDTYFGKFDIDIKDKNLLSGDVTLNGTIADIEKAFDMVIATFEGANRNVFISNVTQHLLPVKLHQLVAKVEPFTPPVKKEFRLPTRITPLQKGATAQAALPAGYTPPELAKAFNFPQGLDGTGQVIGIIELGGEFDQADFNMFYSQLGIKPPHVIQVGTPPVVTGPTQTLDNAEVTLDMEVVGSIAPNATLVVYYGNTIADAMKAIVNDRVNKPTVVSISWAGSESAYSTAEIQEMDLLFYQASLLGITVLAASADHGAYNGMQTPNVSLPSSNPLVLGCGGTIVNISNNQIQSEVVWNELNGQVASGGGYSSLYNLPSYQTLAVHNYPYIKYPTRGVPDISADASMQFGYRVVFNGAETVIGGTSAATPFVAILIALINQKLGHNVGFINALLYGQAGTAAFRQVTSGNNQLYAAAPYWNPCTGLGSPVGDRLLAFFESIQQ